jgi:WD40 repeat protein/transcriptional regulator with XRE-family HTH domain
MEHLQYRERDYAFGQAMLTLRIASGLTQAGLADLLGISRQAVVRWEAGSSYPQTKHLKHFLALCLQQQAFPPGREADEIRSFWKIAHQKGLFDENWLAALLDNLRSSAVSRPTEDTSTSDQVVAQPILAPKVDLRNVLAVPTFYGREREMEIITSWILEDRCQVVSVLGLGGIGKSALAVSLMYRLAEHFEGVIWRSVRDAPACEAFLDDCLRVLAPEPLGEVPTSLERRIDLFMEYLVSQRVLLVIDNIETLLEDKVGTGHLLPGYEGYGKLLRRVAESTHQSCMLLTSREKPRDLVSQTGNLAPVRTLRLAGLEISACKQMLGEQGVTGAVQEQEELIERYGSNPLALKIVAQTIIELFGSKIAPFLEQGEVVFGGVRELLAGQFDRLSPAEQSTLLWLAILREPVTLNELLAVQGVPLARVEVLEALDALRRRSLIEPGKHPGSFTLQSVVLEYTTARLIQDAVNEIQQGRLACLIEHGLGLATTREYIREVIERILITPILERLRSLYPGQNALEEQLIMLLGQLRQRSLYAQGYGPKNMLRLLRALRGHLRGLDLSYLLIRGMDLQGVEMQDTNLSGATLQDTVFAEIFDVITTVAISPSGRCLAAASKRGELGVWPKGGRTRRRIWQAHTDQVWTITFSPDDRTLATGSFDSTIKLWDPEQGTLLWTGWHTGIVYRVTFSPDGRTLASCGGDGLIRFWDARQGTPLQTLAISGGPALALAWSPDGHLLASGSTDSRIWLWDLRQAAHPETGLRMLTGHTHWVNKLAFSPDGRTLASGSWDHTVKLWDVDSLSLRETLSGHTDHVFGMAWSPDGRLLASCSVDHTIRLWDVEKASYRAVLHGHTGAVNDIAFSPDSRSLLSGSDDATVRLWDVEHGECTGLTRSYRISLNDMDWSPDGDQLACASTDTLVTIWDVTGRRPPRVLRGHSWVVKGVAWSPDGRLLASSSWDHSVRVWEESTGACVRILRDPDHDDAPFQGIGWSPDGRFLAIGSFARGVQVWEVATGTRLWVGLVQPTGIRRLAWSPDGSRLASCSDDGSVCLWETSDGRLLAMLQGHRGIVTSVAWSPDGTRLASCGGRGSGELFIWDALSGERLSTLNEPGAVITALAWSQSGSVLVSGGSDGALRWWNVESGECIRIIEGHQGAIQVVKMNPDGQRLASCRDDGTIVIWDSESGEKLQMLRRERPYERLDISGAQGLTESQRDTLRALGAIETS